MRVPVEVSLSPSELAELFCEMVDEQQAQFFIEVSARFRAWTQPAAAAMQVYSIGRHLVTCECSTIEARDWVRELAAAVGSS